MCEKKNPYPIEITTIQRNRRRGMGAMNCILRKSNETAPDRFHSDLLIYQFVNSYLRNGFICDSVSARRHGWIMTHSPSLAEYLPYRVEDALVIFGLHYSWTVSDQVIFKFLYLTWWYRGDFHEWLVEYPPDEETVCSNSNGYIERMAVR